MITILTGMKWNLSVVMIYVSLMAIIVLSEISQSHKDKYHMFSYVEFRGGKVKEGKGVAKRK
jgi:hypothetical protein